MQRNKEGKKERNNIQTRKSKRNKQGRKSKKTKSGQLIKMIIVVKYDSQQAEKNRMKQAENENSKTALR